LWNQLLIVHINAVIVISVEEMYKFSISPWFLALSRKNKNSYLDYS